MMIRKLSETCHARHENHRVGLRSRLLSAVFVLAGTAAAFAGGTFDAAKHVPLTRRYDAALGIESNVDAAYRWADGSYAEWIDPELYVSMSPRSALASYRRLADEGNPAAAHAVGIYYYKETCPVRNFETAVSYFQAAADKGFIPSMNMLGVCYWEGNGVQQDYDKALTLMERAADAGYAPAMANLGLFYDDEHAAERGTEPDYDKVVAYYERAVQNGEVELYVELGDLFMDDEYITKDTEKAAGYFLKAVELDNDTYALHMLMKLCGPDKNPELYNKAVVAARNCFARIAKRAQLKKEAAVKRIPYLTAAAEEGDVAAMSMLAGLYESAGVNNLEQYIRWSIRAADSGDRNLCYTLGLLYRNGGFGVKKDYIQAAKYLKASGNDNADDYLRDIYGHALGVLDILNDDPDEAWWVAYKAEPAGWNLSQEFKNEAFAYFLQKAVQDDPAARTVVARCYAIGIGTDVDMEKAQAFGYEGFDADSVAAAEQERQQKFLAEQEENRKHLEELRQKAENADSDADAGKASYTYAEDYLFYMSNSAENYRAMMPYYEKAAAKGYAPACFRLGTIYEHGWGVPADEQQMISWYRQAAARGDKYSMEKLGDCYLHGKGVPFDYEEACMWYAATGDEYKLYWLKAFGLMQYAGASVSHITADTEDVQSTQPVQSKPAVSEDVDLDEDELLAQLAKLSENELERLIYRLAKEVYGYDVYDERFEDDDAASKGSSSKAAVVSASGIENKGAVLADADEDSPEYVLAQFLASFLARTDGWQQFAARDEYTGSADETVEALSMVWDELYSNVEDLKIYIYHAQIKDDEAHVTIGLSGTATNPDDPDDTVTFDPSSDTDEVTMLLEDGQWKVYELPR